MHRVDEQEIRLNGELRHRVGHRLAAGLVDVPGVDAAGVHLCHAPGHGVLANALAIRFRGVRE